MPSVDIPINTPETADQAVGAVGHFISAVLQTAGFMFQSDIIKNFSGLLTELGVLFFVASAIGAIASFAIFGQARQTLYLLIASSIFYSLVFYTVPGQPTLLKVGARTAQASKSQLDMLQQVSGRNFLDEKVNVSWFFIQFDRLVSSVVQSLVNFLVDTKNSADLVAVAREKAVSDIFSKNIAEPQFTKLLAMGLMGECSRYSFIKGEISSIDTQLANKITVEPRRSSLMGMRDKYLTELAALQKVQRPIDGGISKYVWAMEGTQFSTPPESLTCDEIWAICWIRAQQLAVEEINNSTNQGQTDANQFPWDKVRDEVIVAAGDGNPQEAVRVIAANMFKNTIHGLPSSVLATRMATNSGMDAAKYEVGMHTIARGEAEGDFLLMQFFASLIPYIQGFILFCLTAAFPFFCLLLLIPSRASGFLIWMSLWIWVKSWDVGFAAIVTVREILWTLLSPGIRPTLSGNWNDMSFLFSAVNSNDPIANLTMYYVIVSLLTISVPMVTAHLFMGGNDAFRAFRNAIDETALRVQDRGAKAAKRNFGDFAEAKGWELDTKFAQQAARDATLNQGGLAYGSNTPRYAVAGGKMARYIQGYSDQERNRYHLQEQAVQQRGILAMVTGRAISMTGTGMMAGAESYRIADLAAEPFETPSINQAHGNLLGGVLPEGESYLPSTMNVNQKTTTGSPSQAQRAQESD